MPLYQIYECNVDTELYTAQLYSEFQPLYVNVVDDIGINRTMLPTDKIEAPTMELALSVWEQGITVANYLDQHSVDQDSKYHRPLDSVLIGFGGQLVDSSNWISKENHSQKTNGVSFSPTEVWSFPDESMLEITSSGTRVMKV